MGDLTPHKPTSPWVFVGIGCGLLVVAGMIAIAGVAWWGQRIAKTIKAEMTDPERRSRNVMRALGATAFPEGYVPAFTFSVPMIAEVAILSDRPPVAGKDDLFESRGFVYVKTRSSTRDRKKLDDFFAGRVSAPELLGPARVTMAVTETLGRGSFPRERDTVSWIAQRGSISLPGRPPVPVGDGVSPNLRGDQRIEGILTLIRFECPGDDRLRLGVWMERSGSNPSDNPADEGAIRQFASHFAPCGVK